MKTTFGKVTTLHSHCKLITQHHRPSTNFEVATKLLQTLLL